MKLNLFNIYYFLLSFFDGGFAGFKLEIPVLFLFIIPYLWPFIIAFNFLTHWIVFFISMIFLGICKNEVPTMNRVVFKSALFGFFFDVLTVVVMSVLSIIIENIFIVDKNFQYALGHNVFRSIPALFTTLLAIFITRYLFYYFNMKYNISKLEIEKDKIKKLNLILTIFTAPYICLAPFDIFFK